MTGSAASYEAGDHVGIYIENGTDIVEKVCRLLQHSPDTILQFKHPPGNPDRLAPCPTGVYQAGRSFPSCPCLDAASHVGQIFSPKDCRMALPYNSLSQMAPCVWSNLPGWGTLTCSPGWPFRIQN